MLGKIISFHGSGKVRSRALFSSWFRYPVSRIVIAFGVHVHSFLVCLVIVCVLLEMYFWMLSFSVLCGF